MTNKKEITVNLVKFRIRQAVLGEFGFKVEKGLEMTKNVSVPEGYKKTELEVIPKDWNVIKVNDFCDVKTGGTPSTKNKEFWDGDIPWMSSGEINKTFVYDTEKKITQKGLENSNARILPADSVMMALNGQGKTRGSVAVLKIPSTCNQSLACMIPNQKITHYLYLFYNLQSRYSEIRNYTGDTGREGLNLKIIKDIKVPLPSFLEQQKIASILSKVDEQIEQTEQIIEKTELLKKGLMQKLLTKGIGHTKFKKTELGEIPEEWKVVNFGDSCNFFDHLRVPLKKSDRVKRSGSYPYYGAQNIIDWVDDYIFDGDYLLIAEDGENLKSKVLPIAYQVSGKFWVNNHAHVVKPKEDHIIGYLEYILNFIDIDRYIIGSAQPKLNQNTAKKIKIPLPPLSEQQKIASILSKVDSHIQDNQNYLTKLQELKKGLMQDLLTGKVRV